MMKNKIWKKRLKSTVAIFLAMALAVTLIPIMQNINVSAATLNNPRKDSNGNVTYDCVWFGSYPQSDATGVKKDPIKWRVLEVNGNDAFLVADCNLDVQRYNNTDTNVTWETCTMRKWLNSDFMNRAFTGSEQSAIKTTTIVNADNPYYGTEGGNNTQDKVFLLSLDEVMNEKYGFSSDYSDYDNARKRKNTAYVAKGGTIGSGSTDYWWLRSPGNRSTSAAYVSGNGIVDRYGFTVDYRIYAACPALHLNLASSNLWSYAGTVSSDGTVIGGQKPPIEEDNLPDMSDMLTYEQYQAEYYSDNAELITGAYMTYSEIEDNYEPTTYALNNMLSFGWKARFGFSDSAQIWETMLLDILFKTGAGSSSITAWEKKSVKLSEDLCKYISKNNLADVDKSISSDYKENLKKIINKTNETKGFYDESTTVGDIVNTLADSAKTVKEAMEIYAKYVELRKMLDSDIVAFLKQLKGTQNYKNIPAFQRAVDKVTANINVDSKKLLSLIIQEKGVDSVVKKAVNWVVGSAVEVILGEKILKLADITKATTIHLMNTICGTDELAQSNIYLYMLNRIDEAATEAFKNASGICLTSGGKQCYQVVNGGLQFITNLYYQGIAVCRKWSRTLSTDILTRIETGPYVSVKRPHYDMATAYFNLNRKSSTEEKMQYIEEKCNKDEEYVNVVLENQPAFARIQWYKDSGISEQENSCLAIFKVENPNGRYSLYAQVVPKNTVVKFPGLSVKNGYKIPSEWYVDEDYTQSVGSMPIITDDITYYARYTKNILFETNNEGAKIISLNGTAKPKAKSLMKSFNTTDVTLQKEKYEIPAYIDGYKVVELGEDIFDEMSGIKEVFIPATVKKISDKAFKSLMEDTTYRYVEGSVAEEYLKNKEYQSIIAEEELILKESVVMLKAGENKQLQLERKGSCVAEEILWQSSNNDIVKVENGKVYGLKEGIAIVMATAGSVTVKCEVRVEGHIADSSKTTTTSSDGNKIIKKPISTKLKKIQSKKRSLKIVWKKTKKVNGYQIQYSTSRKFKKVKKITIKNAKITSKTLKKLKAKKKYYVRIRTYIVVNGKKYYSDWSKTKVKRTK